MLALVAVWFTLILQASWWRRTFVKYVFMLHITSHHQKFYGVSSTRLFRSPVTLQPHRRFSFRCRSNHTQEIESNTNKLQPGAGYNIDTRQRAADVSKLTSYPQLPAIVFFFVAVFRNFVGR